MSPILIRPVREQLEHDRIIRQLQAKYKRKHDPVVNVGDETTASVKVGTQTLFPDVVLMSPEPPRRVQGVIEVETGESVNNLEAMAQWAHFAKARVPFYLYVPVSSVEIARRLCEDHQIAPTELWTYLPLGEQIRFVLAQRNAPPEPLPTARAEKPAKEEKPRKAAARSPKPARPAKAAPPSRGARPSAARKSAPAPAKKRTAARSAQPARKTSARQAATRSRPRPARAQKRR